MVLRTLKFAVGIESEDGLPDDSGILLFLFTLFTVTTRTSESMHTSFLWLALYFFGAALR